MKKVFQELWLQYFSVKQRRPTLPVPVSTAKARRHASSVSGRACPIPQPVLSCAGSRFKAAPLV